MSLLVGSIVKSKHGVVFLVETSTTRQFPDGGTLTALTLGIGDTRAPTVTDAMLAVVPSGAPFASVAAYAAAHPKIVADVQRIVRALIPTMGLRDLNGGMMTIAESSENLFDFAIANPGNWANQLRGRSKTKPLSNAHEAAGPQPIIELLDSLLQKLTNSALSADQTAAIGDSVNDVANDVSGPNDDDDMPTKDNGDKDDVKDVSERKNGEKKASAKDPGSRVQGEKEEDEKDYGEPGNKNENEKHVGEKEEKNM
jgi:hypothetical protein